MLTPQDAIAKVNKPKIVKLSIPGCPASFVVATPAAGDGPAWTHAWGIAAGRGLDEKDALESALAETIERMSVWARGPDDFLLRKRSHADSIETIEPSQFLQFSGCQAADLLTLWHETRLPASANVAFDVENLHMPMRALGDGRTVHVPVIAALFGEELRRGFPRQISTSAGTAAHTRPDAARDAAVLELVERDAVALWWYRRLVPRRLPDALAHASLPESLADWLSGRERVTRFLDLPTDLPASVVLAVSTDGDGTLPAIGVAAHLEPERALLSAALEMLQGEISLKLMADAQALPDPPPVPPLLAFARATRLPDAGFLAGRPDDPLAGRKTPFEERTPLSMDDLVAAFVRAGIDVFVADITRPELGLPCMRAVSPQLRDWAPRFGPGRLYEVPAALGLAPADATEDDLAREPFPI